ncbi:Uncharacterised protein [Mycobacteroides abscessus subsp. abscessus]|nr:Uncharacterised protein [Mycobacteroides abscessus subsp. abscessus]
MTDHHVASAFHQQFWAASHHGVSAESVAGGGEVHAKAVGVGVVSNQSVCQHQWVHGRLGPQLQHPRQDNLGQPCVAAQHLDRLGDPSQMLRGRRYLLCHLSIRHCAVELLGQSALDRDGSRQCDGTGGVERQGTHQHVMTAGAQGFRRGEDVVIGRIAAIRVQRVGGSRHHEMWAGGRVGGRHVSLTVPGAGTRLGQVRRPGAGRARGRR